MSRFQLKITHHIFQGEWKKTIDVNIKMPEMLELCDKEFKAVMIKMLHEQL